MMLMMMMRRRRRHRCAWCDNGMMSKMTGIQLVLIMLILAMTKNWCWSNSCCCCCCCCRCCWRWWWWWWWWRWYLLVHSIIVILNWCSYDRMSSYDTSWHTQMVKGAVSPCRICLPDYHGPPCNNVTKEKRTPTEPSFHNYHSYYRLSYTIIIYHMFLHAILYYICIYVNRCWNGLYESIKGEELVAALPKIRWLGWPTWPSRIVMPELGISTEVLLSSASWRLRYQIFILPK